MNFNFNKKIFFFSLLFVFGLVSLVYGSHSEPGHLYFFSHDVEVEQGEVFEVQLQLNVEEDINAVESSISFSDNLELVGVNRENSVLDIWLERPSISGDGNIYFLGGTSNSVQGNALSILTIRFRALNEGSANIAVEEGRVAAADGEGTNILDDSIPIDITVVPEGELDQIETGLELIPEVEEAINGQLPQPDQSTTTQVEEGAPPKPIVSIPAYPDQSRWYDFLSDNTRVYWGLPENVDRIAFSVDSNPRSEPTEAIEEGVCCGVQLPPIGEGVSYFHIRFGNEAGWGPTTHHRINIDHTSPTPVEIGMESRRTTDRTPEVTFEAHDVVSGIREYRVYVDNEDPIITTQNSVILPEQSPGQHSVQVQAADMAGNYVTQEMNFTILFDRQELDEEDFTVLSGEDEEFGGIDSIVGFSLLFIILVGAGWRIIHTVRS